MTDETHSCPQRDESYNAVSAYPTQDTWREDGTCSYCGSMSPDTFMEAIEKCTSTVVPTDKNYKAYVQADGSEMRVKFYFPHLSEDQKKRFVELLKEGKMKFDYPGHFYRLPFFIKGE